MKLVYVSHPFTGNEVENRQDARETCAQLKEEHPDWCIVDPLGMFAWLDYVKISYEDALKMCIAVLERCDAIYLCQGWDDSKGCREERKAAKNKGLEVIYE